jgi:hypothetical protein
MLSLSCLLGTVSIKELCVVDVWVFLLELANLVIEDLFLLLCALGVESVVLRLFTIINDLSSELSELLQLLQTRQLPVNVLLELAELLPRLSECLQLLHNLCLVPLLVNIVARVKVLVVDIRCLQAYNCFDSIQIDTLPKNEGKLSLIRVRKGNESIAKVNLVRLSLHLNELVILLLGKKSLIQELVDLGFGVI